MKKNAEELSLRTVVTAIIILIVLIVLITIFNQQVGTVLRGFSDQISNILSLGGK